MSFKFVAQHLETGKTGSLTVKATSEAAARQKLVLGGYEVVRLVRVTNGQESTIKIHSHPKSASFAPAVLGRAAKKEGFAGFLANLVAKFELLVYYC
jgi:hypothetical protein